MKKILSFIFLLSVIAIPFSLTGQITSLTDAQSLDEGAYTFNFGNGNFQGYIDEDGWILWMQYHHEGGTNPNLNVIQLGNDLPIFDDSPLGTDLSGDASKWGHGAQDFAASIPDNELWLRWEAETSHHTRKIHFESPVLGRFQSNTGDSFTPEIKYMNIHRDDHTANLPENATDDSSSNNNNVLISGPFWSFNENSWEVNSGNRWNVDNVRNTDETLIYFEHSTIHRVWVKPIPFNSEVLFNSLDELQDHINGVITLTDDELNQLKNIFYIYADQFANSESLIIQAQSVIADYDAIIGPLFTTANTENGFPRDPLESPSLNLERAMVALQQGIFDFVFTPEVHTQYPELVEGIKFNSCVSFPGELDPPTDPSVTNTVLIRANFEDPEGINPYYDINGDGTAHAFRPTGMYLAPGSIATITVPSSMVGQDYYIRIGAHEWDLSNKPTLKRLDRISKKFAINSTTIEVFNPLGGAIGILVPYEATQGIVEVTIGNAVEAPFYSLKSFYESPDFNTELEKPAPWAVFETDNVMYTIPKHAIVPGEYDLMQTLKDWDTALQAISSILSRQIIPDKHDLYMINDVFIRGGAYSIGYPMSNTPINYSNVPGNAYFIDGPGPRYETNFHEYGHSVNVSKFPGEVEALVNFPYIMALNYGLGEDLNEAVKYSFVPNTFDIDKSATHRLVSNSFGTERDISNSTTNEVRYQHRGYAHYFEIVDLIGWCSHRNFWKKEFIDSENGIDYGEDIDTRILKMSIAAAEDLRPLFHVFGILPQDPAVLQDALNENDIPESLIIYNRLQEYLNLIPTDNDSFIDYALSVYPELYSSGPSANPDYGVGWHYQKSLTYTMGEASVRTSTLLDIIDLYYPSGDPDISTSEICCMFDNILIELIDDEVIVTGGTPPYDINIEISGNTQIVTVLDFNGCLATAEFSILNLTEVNKDDVIIFPNPTSGKLYINLTDNNSQIKTLQLYSTTGQIISNLWEADNALDLSQVTDGMYILQITLDNDSFVYKRVLVLK